MSENLGVSSGIKWLERRKMNELVLNTNKIHQYIYIYNDYTKELLKNNIPTNFQEFKLFGENMIGKIVFNDINFNKKILNIFNEANSIYPIIFNKPISLDSKKIYDEYLYENINNPKQNSLVKLGLSFYDNFDNNTINEIYNQIPHWMFPIGGLYHSVFPRMLCLLANNKDKLTKLINELKNVYEDLDIIKIDYVRFCILETIIPLFHYLEY
jgi:hypothetical protein